MANRLACALCLLLAPAALGQRTLFLRPESPRLPAGAALMVHLESAKGPAPWERIGLILVQGQDTRENMDQLPGAPDAAGAVQLPALPPGAGAVGLDLRPAVETLDAGALRAFTIAKCARQLPEDVTGKVRVRRLQSCKALVRVGDAPGNAAAALNETSQRAEIATRMDPTRATIGSDIAFAISIDGTDVEDERVIATCIATGREQEVESREGGAGSFRITAAGLWRGGKPPGGRRPSHPVALAIQPSCARRPCHSKAGQTGPGDSPIVALLVANFA